MRFKRRFILLIVQRNQKCNILRRFLKYFSYWDCGGSQKMLLVNMDRTAMTKNDSMNNDTQYHLGIHYKRVQWGQGL